MKGLIKINFLASSRSWCYQKNKKPPHLSPKPVLNNNIWWHPFLSFLIISYYHLIIQTQERTVASSIWNQKARVTERKDNAKSIQVLPVFACHIEKLGPWSCPEKINEKSNFRPWCWKCKTKHDTCFSQSHKCTMFPKSRVFLRWQGLASLVKSCPRPVCS